MYQVLSEFWSESEDELWPGASKTAFLDDAAAWRGRDKITKVTV
jgi:hypothetical protein